MHQIYYKLYTKSMSKHSKNNTSSTVFTYAERQKLKNVYGTIQNRVSQDSIKKFEDCSICHNRLVEPTSCDHGHLFCRSCAIEYLVKQKKKLASDTLEITKLKQQQSLKNQQKNLQKQVEKLQKFQKFDNFIAVTSRNELFKPINPPQKQQSIKIDLKTYVKPTGIYQENKEKQKYVKSSFWTIQNTPDYSEKVQQKSQKFVQCPGTGANHKLTLKKLRDIKINELDNTFCCWVCRKQIGKQKIGCYKCGHLVCITCKSQKCQICDQRDRWLQIEGNSSSFSSRNNVQIKTYTHAFIS